MTFTEYSPVSGRKTGQLYPPAAPMESIPNEFDRSYRGSDEVARRIRLALSAFAIRCWRFWQSSILIVGIGTVATIVVGRDEWRVDIPAAIFVLGMASLAPIFVLWEIRGISRSYAKADITYSASFSTKAMLWQTATGTYEIPWGMMISCMTRANVTIIALENTRAICVIPHELITPAAEVRLRRIGSNANV
jgi:hypothetical protein